MRTQELSTPRYIPGYLFHSLQLGMPGSLHNLNIRKFIRILDKVTKPACHPAPCSGKDIAPALASHWPETTIADQETVPLMPRVWLLLSPWTPVMCHS